MRNMRQRNGRRRVNPEGRGTSDQQTHTGYVCVNWKVSESVMRSRNFPGILQVFYPLKSPFPSPVRHESLMKYGLPSLVLIKTSLSPSPTNLCTCSVPRFWSRKRNLETVAQTFSSAVVHSRKKIEFRVLGNKVWGWCIASTLYRIPRKRASSWSSCENA